MFVCKHRNPIHIYFVQHLEEHIFVGGKDFLQGHAYNPNCPSTAAASRNSMSREHIETSQCLIVSFSDASMKSSAERLSELTAFQKCCQRKVRLIQSCARASMGISDLSGGNV